MLRQLLQALRFDIEDFFAVPAPAVAALLASVICLGACVYIRTVYFSSSHQTLQWLLLGGALTGFSIAGRYFKKR